MTADLDLFVETSGSNLRKFVRAMVDLGYQPKMPARAESFIGPEERRRWKDEKGMQKVSFYHPLQPMKLIDLSV